VDTTGPNDQPSVSARLGLDHLAEMARETTGARYAVLAVLNEQRTELEHLSTVGVDERARWAIGHAPPARGALTDLISDPGPSRLGDIRRHPSMMRSFLGVPIMIHAQVWGSLRLAEKARGEFTEGDEAATVALAQEAANRISFERRGLRWPSNALHGLSPLVQRTQEAFKSLGGPPSPWGSFRAGAEVKEEGGPS
jgi:two-component system, NarL family, sensor histidine kinase DevS